MYVNERSAATNLFEDDALAEHRENKMSMRFPILKLSSGRRSSVVGGGFDTYCN